MKVEQVSEHIWSLKTWMLIPLHVWVVVDDEGVTLVDAGVSMMSKGIMNFIDSLGAGSLQRILLTHGHSDHVGSVNKIVGERPDVTVFSHRIELPFINGDRPYPRRKKAESNITKGLVKPLVENEDGNLKVVAGLTPYLTPGHAPGHVVYYHEEDKVLLAGDLFTSKKGKLHRPMPMFTADMKEALRSSAIVRTLEPERIEVCHGEPVMRPAEHIDLYIEKTTASFSINM